MIPQRQSPSTTRDGFLRVVQALPEILRTATGDSGKQVGCQSKVEGAMQLVVVEVRRRLVHRLNRFCQQENLPAMGIHPLAQSLQELVGLRKPLAARPLRFKKKRNRVEAKSIHTPIDPEIDHLQHRLLH